jgi:hypothetical protein
VAIDQAQLRHQIQYLWQALAGNPANRARAIAHVARNHGSPDIQTWVRELIANHSADSPGRREALLLLLDISEPLFPNIQITWVEEEDNPEPISIRVDPELGRITIAINLASHFRLWVIARELTRAHNGSGWVSKKALRAALARFNISYSDFHLRRLLQEGQGLFWNLSPKRVYIRSSRFLSRELTRQTLATNPDLVSTNRPGVRDVYLSPSGSLEQWEATLYAGWLAHRNNPTIARETLAALFGRSGDTIRRWEHNRLSDIVSIRKNYSQSRITGEAMERLPEHAQSYLANVYQGKTAQEIRLYWRLPNTYQVAAIRQHPRRGQASKVRKAVNAEFDHPAAMWRGGLQRLKLYFDHPQRLRAYARKRGGVYYLWLGENKHGQGIWEPTSTGFPDTRPRERAGFKPEYWVFKARREKVQAFVMNS